MFLSADLVLFPFLALDPFLFLGRSFTLFLRLDLGCDKRLEGTEGIPGKCCERGMVNEGDDFRGLGYGMYGISGNVGISLGGADGGLGLDGIFGIDTGGPEECAFLVLVLELIYLPMFFEIDR